MELVRPAHQERNKGRILSYNYTRLAYNGKFTTFLFQLTTFLYYCLGRVCKLMCIVFTEFYVPCFAFFNMNYLKVKSSKYLA